MGKSFFTGTDIEVVNESRAFAAKISADPFAFGLTEEQCASYAQVDAILQTAFMAAKDPSQRTTERVIAARDAKRAVREMASDLARIIQGQPNVSDEQRINLGRSVRAAPAPLPPPGQPTRFSVTLDGIGGLILKWTCQNPPGSRGTSYNVWRSIGTGERVYLGFTGKETVRRPHPARGREPRRLSRAGGALDQERPLGTVRHPLRHERQHDAVDDAEREDRSVRRAGDRLVMKWIRALGNRRVKNGSHQRSSS